MLIKWNLIGKLWKYTHKHKHWVSQVAQLVESACNAGYLSSVPGSGRSPGKRKGSPLQCSCLENSMDGGALRATVHGVSKSQTRLSNFTFWVGLLFLCISQYFPFFLKWTCFAFRRKKNWIQQLNFSFTVRTNICSEKQWWPWGWEGCGYLLSGITGGEKSFSANGEFFLLNELTWLSWKGNSFPSRSDSLCK